MTDPSADSAHLEATPSPGLAQQCLGELAGTFILVFFGIGAVHVAVLTGALQGLWQVAIVWGLAIALAIYATAALSGAHINPAITLAFAAWRRFPWAKVPSYILSQLAGAFLAAALLYAIFTGVIQRFETSHALVRGQPGSELSAMVYGEYFPNPSVAGTTHGAFESLSLGQAMFAEAIGAALLAFFVFALTEERNIGRPRSRVAPIFIGLGVSIIICVVAPLTQGCFNPARDFGPRLFAWFAGWGDIAIPGPRGGFFTVYILSPIVGALVGSAVYHFALRPAMRGGERS